MCLDKNCQDFITAQLASDHASLDVRSLQVLTQLSWCRLEHHAAMHASNMLSHGLADQACRPMGAPLNMQGQPGWFAE